jgi:hypothetical protein
MSALAPLDVYIKKQLDDHLIQLAKMLNTDMMAIVSPIMPGLELRVRSALEQKKTRGNGLSIILDTGGGVVEVVERMVECIRTHYPENVKFIVPNRAMSAGTVFAMSGDEILMDYFSCLGPIDPQIENETGKLIPALSYLNQFERLNKKAENGELTSAEYALLNKLDLAELHHFEQARELSKELLVKWLTKYKFKNWTKTEGTGKIVTPSDREARAKQIAGQLSDNEKWHSHGRGINLKTLKEKIGLQIKDYGQEDYGKTIKEYFDLLVDYMSRQKLFAFVHTTEYF